MTLDEAKELFPEVSKESPKNAFGYIYITFEPISGKFYIGKRKSNRWLKWYYGSGHYPMKWLENNISLEHWPIKWCNSKDELNDAEYTWIEIYKHNKDIANMMGGGLKNNYLTSELKHNHLVGENNPFYGKSFSKESKEKLSNSLKEYFKTHDNPFLRHKHTDETKKLISEKNKNYYLTHDNPRKGKPIPESVKEKLRQKAIERNLDPKFRENISKRLKEFYKNHDAKFLGCQHTEEAKEQMSKRKVELFGKERTDYIPNTDKLYGCAQDRIRVICLDTMEVFNSISDAERAYGVKKSHISDVCKGKRRTALGHKWAFYEEEYSESSYLQEYSYSDELGLLEYKTCLV